MKMGREEEEYFPIKFGLRCVCYVAVDGMVGELKARVKRQGGRMVNN